MVLFVLHVTNKSVDIKKNSPFPLPSGFFLPQTLTNIHQYVKLNHPNLLVLSCQKGGLMRAKCDICQQVKDKVHRNRKTGKLVCVGCYKPPEKECCICHQTKPVHKKTAHGPVCKDCHQLPKEECCTCHQVKPVHKRTAEGPVCKACYEQPEEECCNCGKIRPVAECTPEGPICMTCYNHKYYIENIRPLSTF